MAISIDYPTPVTVNGYACKNCTDVDFAKQHIDPAHPKDGPFGIDAASPSASDRSSSVKLDGKLGPPAHADASAQPGPYRPGSLLNLTA